MTPRPFILTEVFAAYLLIRGVLYPILLSHGEPAQGIVGGVLQILIAAGMTFYALRFYRGRYGSRLPMILMTLCALWVTASTLVQSVSTYGVSIEGFNPLIVAGVIGAAVAFIFVLLPSSRRYIEAVTEERGEEANRLGRRR